MPYHDDGVTVTTMCVYTGNHLKHPPSSCSKKKAISSSVFINDNMVSIVYCTSSDIHFKHFHIGNVAGISGCIFYSKKYVHVGGTNNMSPAKEELSIEQHTTQIPLDLKQIPLDLTEHFVKRLGLGDTFNAIHLSVSW